MVAQRQEWKEEGIAKGHEKTLGMMEILLSQFWQRCNRYIHVSKLIKFYILNICSLLYSSYTLKSYKKIKKWINHITLPHIDSKDRNFLSCFSTQQNRCHPILLLTTKSKGFPYTDTCSLYCSLYYWSEYKVAANQNPRQNQICPVSWWKWKDASIQGKSQMISDGNWSHLPESIVSRNKVRQM